MKLTSTPETQEATVPETTAPLKFMEGTHPTRLPQTPAEEEYCRVLLQIKAIRPGYKAIRLPTAQTNRDAQEASRLTREVLKPMLYPYGGTIPSIRADILANAIKEGWITQ